MSDQQRWDTLGCYGCRAIPTPALDGLAAGGVLFDRCYVNATICTPSRACMLTGKPLPGYGVYRLHDTLPDDQVLLPAHLQGLGYHTALVGKLHVSGHMVEASGATRTTASTATSGASIRRSISTRRSTATPPGCASTTPSFCTASNQARRTTIPPKPIWVRLF